MPLGHGPEPQLEPELVALCRRRRRKLVARSMCAQKRFVTAYEARVWMSVCGCTGCIGCANCLQLSVSALPAFCLVSHSRLIMHKLKSNCKDDAGGEGRRQCGVASHKSSNKEQTYPQVAAHRHGLLAAPWRVPVPLGVRVGSRPENAYADIPLCKLISIDCARNTFYFDIPPTQTHYIHYTQINRNRNGSRTGRGFDVVHVDIACHNIVISVPTPTSGQTTYSSLC